MLYTRRPLQEKMTLFWHDHFATANSKVANSVLMLQQIQLFRDSGLGNFEVLLQKVAASYQTPVQYPANNGLANQLKLVAQVIAGNLGTRLFSVSMGGYDTHANQKPTQDKHLAQLGDALEAFIQDLATIGQQDNVVIMSFSEFGRRVKQNGSNGTDHGTAEPMFIIGNKVQGGLYGTYPSLEDLDNNG